MTAEAKAVQAETINANPVITTDNKGNVIPSSAPSAVPLTGQKGIASVMEFKALITDAATMQEAKKVGALIVESKKDKETTDLFVSAMVSAGKGVLTGKKQVQTAIELLLSLQGVNRGSNPDRWDYIIGKLIVPEVLARLGIVEVKEPKVEKSIAQVVARLAKGKTPAQMVEFVNAALVFCPPAFAEEVAKVLKSNSKAKALAKA